MAAATLMTLTTLTAAAASPEVALAGLGLSALPLSALPWREGLMMGLPVAGTAAGRIVSRVRRR